MKNEDDLSLIDEIERELAMLPLGSIVKKRVKEKEYNYHRYYVNGKRKEEYIPFEGVKDLKEKIEKRKELETKLKKLLKEEKNLKSLKKENENKQDEKLSFNTTVRYGKTLEAQISSAWNFKKRECIKTLRDYIFGSNNGKVFVIYGLRRTGKTTMMRQIISELNERDFKKAAYIQITSKDSLSDLDEDIKLLEKEGYKYLFIDEVTLLEDFVEGAAIFADIYASSGMKIVLSGTDSLGFALSKEEQLYDRCIMLHSTFISYREFERVLGIKGIDEYIRYGGTMSISGASYNDDSTFSSKVAADEYIDTAIAKNIQHSLKLYEYGSHFRSLLELYEHGELTNVINRVIENINHSFTKSVVEKAFKSHDIAVWSNNMLKDKNKSINVKKTFNEEEVTKHVMKLLDIINKEEQSIDIEDSHLIEIKEYLKILDLIVDIDLEYLPEEGKSSKLVVISQPGLRYAQAEAIIESILMDHKFGSLDITERWELLERLLNEVKGRMMEEIVLLETRLAFPGKKVFKLQFAIGEFDMVIHDPKTLTSKVFEIKHSDKQISDQHRHLDDKEKCKMTEHRFGKITGKYVIYRGESKKVKDIEYLNVEEYLLGLNK